MIKPIKNGRKNIAIKAIIHPLFSPSILEIRTIVIAKKIITKISPNTPITSCSVESPIILLTINVNIKIAKTTIAGRTTLLELFPSLIKALY